jgi:rubrerythrin
MEHYSVREAVEQAIQTEKLGYEFYTEMAKRFRETEGIRKLFETLAIKEQRHERKFSELKGKVKDEEIENRDEVSQYLRAIVESEFFLGKGKSLPSLDHVKTVSEAIRFALSFEKETLLYFYAIKEAIKERVLIDEIIEEEKSHIAWLNSYAPETTK